MLLYIWLEEKWGNEALGSITRIALQNKGRWVAGWYSLGSSLTNYPFIYIGFSCVQMTIDHCPPCTTHSPCRPIMGQHHWNHINSIQFLLAHPRLFKLIAGWQHPMLGWIIGVPMGPTGQSRVPDCIGSGCTKWRPHLMATTSMAVMYYSWNAGTSNVVKTQRQMALVVLIRQTFLGKECAGKSIRTSKNISKPWFLLDAFFDIFWGSWWYMLVNC